MGLFDGLSNLADQVLDAFSSNPFSTNADKSTAPNPLSLGDYKDWYKTASGGNPKYWAISGDDWYKVFPHRFEVGELKADGSLDFDSRSYFSLPIPPQAIRIMPVYASQVTPTIGGVVEEVSPVTLWKITMSGTMGTGIGYKNQNNVYAKNTGDRENLANSFRDKVSTTGLLSGLGNGVQGALSAVSAVGDTAIGAVGALANGNIAGAVSGAVASINNAFLPKLPYTTSAVPQNSNGFTEIHELQKFFHIYSQMKSYNPKKFALYFSQFKTSQKWRIIVNSFSISQNSTSPNQYKYDIDLTGWDCSSTEANNKLEYDRFAPGTGDLAAVNTVSLQTTIKLMKELGGNLSEDFKNTGVGEFLGAAADTATFQLGG